LVIVIGFIGFAADLFFHWVAAGFEDGSQWVSVSLLDYIKELFMDVDPAVVPAWVTVTGLTAHIFFFVGFPFLIYLGFRELIKSHKAE